jgi:hypothetical protein
MASLDAAYKHHLEPEMVTVVSDSSSRRAEHHPAVEERIMVAENQGKEQAALVAGDGVPHKDLAGMHVDKQGEAVAAADDPTVEQAAGDLQAEGLGRDAAGGIQGWVEGYTAVFLGEETEDGGSAAGAVVGAEAAEEAGVADKTAPALAGEGGAREGGGLRGEAEEDLREEVVVLQRRRRRRVGEVAAACHLDLAPAWNHRSWTGARLENEPKLWVALLVSS